MKPIKTTPSKLTVSLVLLMALNPSPGIASSSAKGGCEASILLDSTSAAARESRINELLKSLASNTTPSARTELQRLLELDDLNFAYFLSLYQTHTNPKAKEPLQIFEEGKDTTGKSIAFPTAIASQEMMTHLKYVTYESLQKYARYAPQAALWVEKMQAGTGSSITRTSYLAKRLGIPESQVTIGAKGTDLFVGNHSIAELQIAQLILASREGHFGKIIFQDIVGTETQDSITALWDKPSLIDPKYTYRQLIEADPKLASIQATIQAYLPTVNEAGQVTFARQAPGGHALFAVNALRAAFIDALRPKTAKGQSLIAVIGNGEDLSSTPDAAMVGWMAREKVAIVMVTTEKTANDLKGGQIALVKSKEGATYATIIEQAQAKESNQLSLFEKLGLDVKRDNQIAFFNTNMALFNYEVLVPKIKKLVAEIGEAQFMRLVAPDLIANWKEQKDPDGVARKYLQLEGAMGSTLLNLDRVWRERYNEPLVQFINVGKQNRTQFFSPIKSAFDYFMQFMSDRFSLNPKTMQLVNHTPGILPSVTLKDASTKDKFYQDIDNTINAFKNTSVVGLNQLTVDGQVLIQNFVLRGNVSIVNKTGTLADLTAYVTGQATANGQSILRDKKGRIVLENIAIEIN